MNVVRPPENLQSEESLILAIDSQSRKITLICESDKKSYDLGSYWRMDERKLVRTDRGETVTKLGARVYLILALGGREAFVDRILETAYNWGAAIVAPTLNDVMRYEAYEADEIENITWKNMFSKVETDGDGTNVPYVDSVALREPAYTGASAKGRKS